MIQSPTAARVQEGKRLSILFDTDLPGDVTWALDADSECTWADFADPTLGECTGTAAADGGGLLIVTATAADGTVETAGVAVEVLPAGFVAVYDPVRTEAGNRAVATPELWGLWNRLSAAALATAPPGWTIDRTGVASGPMPDAETTAVAVLRDELGRITTATILLEPVASLPFAASVADAEEDALGRQVLGLAAGETVDKLVSLPGATFPVSASLTAGPPWTTVSDGGEVRVGGETDAEASGYVELLLTDATGASRSFGFWCVVGRLDPYLLVLPTAVEGQPEDVFPADLYARIVGGTPPHTLAVEFGAASVDSDTRLITGMFPADPGTTVVRLSATDAALRTAFASMNVVTGAPEFAVALADISVAAGDKVNVQPTANEPVVRWGKLGVPWLATSASTGATTGTAPNAPGVALLTVFAVNAQGQVAYADVSVIVTEGLLGCDIPAIDAVRGTAGSVQVAVTNAAGAWTARRESGSTLFAVSSTGEISWGALASSDTDATPVRVRITDAAGRTTICPVTPTISDSGVGACAVTGPAQIWTMTTFTVGVVGSTATGANHTLSTSNSAWTVRSLGAGLFTVTGPVGTTTTLTGALSHNGVRLTCTINVQGVPEPVPLTCTVESGSFPVGSAVSLSATGAGGASSNYTFSADGLPAGTAMSASGSITGSSSVAGPHAYTVTVSDGTNTATCAGTLTIVPALACSATPNLNVFVGERTTGQLPTPASLQGVASFELASGPSYASITSGGAYAIDTPTAVETTATHETTETAEWSYRVTGANGTCTGGTGTITISHRPPTCTAPDVTGFRDEVLSALLTGVNTASSVFPTFALDSGSASGVSLSGNTVTLAAQSGDGDHEYSVTATWSDTGQTATCSGTFTVSGRRLAITGPTQVNVTRTGDKTATWTAVGGVPPYEISFSSLPSWATAGDAMATTRSIRFQPGSGDRTDNRVRVVVTDSTGTRVQLDASARVYGRLDVPRHPTIFGAASVPPDIDLGTLESVTSYVFGYRGGVGPYSFVLPSPNPVAYGTARVLVEATIDTTARTVTVKRTVKAVATVRTNLGSNAFGTFSDDGGDSEPVRLIGIQTWDP